MLNITCTVSVYAHDACGTAKWTNITRQEYDSLVGHRRARGEICINSGNGSHVFGSNIPRMRKTTAFVIFSLLCLLETMCALSLFN